MQTEKLKKIANRLTTITVAGAVLLIAYFVGWCNGQEQALDYLTAEEKQAVSERRHELLQQFVQQAAPAQQAPVQKP